jgi:microcystin-dependent protein
MSLLLLLRNRPAPAPASISTKDYNIWDQPTLDADPGPQQQKSRESTIQNQLGFLMRKTWRTPNPVGCIMQYVGNNAPIGWLFCDGAAYSRVDYSDLYAIISTTYGGSGSTFNVPNFSGRVPVGAGAINDGTGVYTHGMGDSSGETYHQLTESEMPSHNHTSNSNGTLGLATSNGFNTNNGTDLDNSAGELNIVDPAVALTINNTGGGQKHNNMQPYVVVRYIIRY